MATLPTSALMIHFKDYEQYHAHKLNKVCHFFGVPTVMFSLIGLLSYVVLWAPASMEDGAESLFRIDLGILIVVWGCLFAFRVDKKLAIPFSIFVYLNYLVSRHFSLGALVAIQVIGWIFQLVGHYAYEKKSPAFLTTLSHLFVGPMWIFAKAIGYYKA